MNSETGTRLKRLAQRDWVVALCVFVIALLLYIPTLSPSIVLDDGGEMQMLAYRLGVGHPTGYPTQILLSWLFVHLPLAADLALRVTLFSTVTSALALAVLYLAARELNASRLTAAVAALMLAAAPRVWMHASATEVYGLANLLMMLGIWLLFRWGHGRSPLWLVTLAFGFGLTHHINLRLLGPAVLVYILIVDRRLILRPREWLPALAALLLPLLLYAFIPLRADYFGAQPQWAGEILGVRKTIASGLVTPHFYGGFLNLALALDYGQQFLAGDILGLAALDDYATMTLQQVPWPAVVLALLGFVALFRRDWRANVFMLLAYLVSLWAALRFLAAVGEDGDNFIPVYWLMALWFAIGADALVRWAGNLFDSRPAWRRWVVGGLIVALLFLPMFNAVSGWSDAMARRQIGVRAAATGVLAAPVPQGTVIVGDWRDITPLRYLQRVEGVRPDLWVIHADAFGINLLAGRALAEGTPYFVLRSTPAGLRLLPLPARDQTAIHNPDERRFTDAVRWLGFDLLDQSWRPGDVLPLTFYWATDAQPDFDWMTYVHLIDENGEKAAQVDRIPVGDFFRPTAWPSGVVLADQYELTLPPDLPAGRYQIIFGAYDGSYRFPWIDGGKTQFLTEIQVVDS
ncbi:MAG: DUF2723 domain-containing protein [Caldilineales bacterium]|nr:DUF2723 domain-containing protein [Caldilineales bacterium]